MDPTVTPLVQLTVDVLAQVCPTTRRATLEARLPALQAALVAADATEPHRAAALLAQVAFESGWFRVWVEEPSPDSGPHFENYEPGTKRGGHLGNTHQGDGARYLGRGLIQLTGRSNYAAAGRAIGLDLEGNPRLAEQPDVAAKVVGWYWRTHGLNALADIPDLRTMTIRINGGLNGLAYREQAYERARAALGLPPLAC